MIFSLSNFFELLFWVILLLKVLCWVNVLFWVIFWELFWVNLLFWALFWVTFFELDALLGTFTFLRTFKSPFLSRLLFWGLLKVLFFYFFRLKTFMLKTATKREVKSGGRSPQMKFHVENKKFRLYSSWVQISFSYEVEDLDFLLTEIVGLGSIPLHHKRYMLHKFKDFPKLGTPTHCQVLKLISCW